MINRINFKNIFYVVKNHIFSVLLIKPIDLRNTDINLLHFILVSIFYTFFIYLSYLLKLILQFKGLSFISNIIFPIYLLIGCFILIIFAFIGGRIYGILLDENNFKNYYLVLLACGYLPIIISLTGILKKRSGILFVCTGVASEYFLRKSFLIGKTFENSKDKYYFFVLSILMNIGAYWAIFPIFFY